MNEDARLPLDTLLGYLDLEPSGDDTFRAGSPATHAFTRVFGGQLFAQMLIAADRTVDQAKAVHSMHAYFLRPGDQRIPIDFSVERTLDGRSFSNRRVIARQNGKEICNLGASFALDLSGPEYQGWNPEAPTPTSLPQSPYLPEQYTEVMDYVAGDGAIEFRFVDEASAEKPLQSDRWHVWCRLTSPAPDSQVLNSALVAYMSDIFLLETTLRPHAVGWLDDVDFATIDFSMWFHRDFRLDGWHLLSFGAALARAGRALSYGELFNHERTALASMTQEGVTRFKPGRSEDLAELIAERRRTDGN